ncbi:peroxisomal fatty acid beta-oxidation multifunctional protein AIM1-like [Rutidosis leptorrhynchoides]|uniref:peroxisomal fatty acid beta-oxidation multifunctional protein AIM1-like n=1 Tax=Rutidosis leptorrhynchoides TaxID=125765 RepID=UPI003A9A3340
MLKGQYRHSEDVKVKEMMDLGHSPHPPPTPTPTPTPLANLSRDPWGHGIPTTLNYIHAKGSKPKPDPDVLPIIEESKKLVNMMPDGKPITVTDQEIIEMVLFPVVNEACRVPEEGVVVRASNLDVASVVGMSFPSYRGGIVFWGYLIGAKRIYASLKKWSEKYGNFYKPSKFLEEQAKNGVPVPNFDICKFKGSSVRNGGASIKLQDGYDTVNKKPIVLSNVNKKD